MPQELYIHIDGTAAGAIKIPNPDEKLDKFSVMPTASASYAGVIGQYVGTSTSDYTNGYFYRCIEFPPQSGTYLWSTATVQPKGVIDNVVSYNTEDALSINMASTLNNILEVSTSTTGWFINAGTNTFTIPVIGLTTWANQPVLENSFASFRKVSGSVIANLTGRVFLAYITYNAYWNFHFINTEKNIIIKLGGNYARYLNPTSVSYDSSTQLSSLTYAAPRDASSTPVIYLNAMCIA